MSIYTPYTYLIGWSNLDIWYYGRRTGKNCNPADLWNTYFTSSRYVKEFRSLHGEPDVIQVRKTFNTKEKCCIWESKVLHRINAAKSTKWLNKRNSDGLWDTTGIEPVNKGKPRDNATKLKISQTCSNRTFTDSHKENIRLSKLGKPSPNKGKIGWSRNKTLSDDHKNRIREGMKKRHALRKSIWYHWDYMGSSGTLQTLLYSLREYFLLIST